VENGSEKARGSNKNNTFINQNSNENLAPKLQHKNIHSGKEAGNHSFNGFHFANSTQRATWCRGVVPNQQR